MIDDTEGCWEVKENQKTEHKSARTHLQARSVPLLCCVLAWNPTQKMSDNPLPLRPFEAQPDNLKRDVGDWMSIIQHCWVQWWFKRVCATCFLLRQALKDALITACRIWLKRGRYQGDWDLLLLRSTYYFLLKITWCLCCSCRDSLWNLLIH